MVDAIEIWEKPKAGEIYMLAGWRQWADAGSVSSGLPQYLIQQTGARQIGAIRPDGFYLFQIPGTHHLVRPVVKFDEGFPEWLQTQRNELFYAQDGPRGVVIFIGDEPHMDVERYVDALLQAAKALDVKRIVGFGGVYGEVPYDKERMISCVYSLPEMKEEIKGLAINLSDYQGGASIGSYLSKRAGEKDMEYVSFYAFVPSYDFSSVAQVANSIRIENDYTAWLHVMRRVNHMLHLSIDLSGLEEKSDNLLATIDAKVDEIDKMTPQMDIREYLARLADEFPEMSFNPLDEVWEDEIRRLLDKFDDEGEGG